MNGHDVRDASGTDTGSGEAMPAVFVGHGSPMNTLDDNRYTRAWGEIGRSVPRPAVILAISAHWYIDTTAVTAMAHPPTIHDFYGFPDELFAVRYDAPGSPELARAVADLLAPTSVQLDTSWGIDHGTWSVLAHMYPDADIPVMQLSIDATQPPEYHVALGAALHPLRRRGVLIVASGNVVHNLRLVQWDQSDGAFDWARDYDQAARELMSQRPSDIARLTEHRHHSLATPTPDHLLPLFYIAGLAAAADQTATPFAEGYALGSLSMTSYLVAGS